jgi:hypothetical protein
MTLNEFGFQKCNEGSDTGECPEKRKYTATDDLNHDNNNASQTIPTDEMNGDNTDSVDAENLEASQLELDDEMGGDDTDYGLDSWEDEIDGGLMPQASGVWS